MIELVKDAFALALPNEQIQCSTRIISGSTDMGDLSTLMPIIHPYAPGAIGKFHGNNFEIADKEQASVGSAKWQVGILYLLLKDEAKRAKSIIKNFTPLFKNKKEYFDYLSSFEFEGNRITYSEDGTAQIRL